VEVTTRVFLLLALAAGCAAARGEPRGCPWTVETAPSDASSGFAAGDRFVVWETRDRRVFARETATGRTLELPVRGAAAHSLAVDGARAALPTLRCDGAVCVEAITVADLDRCAAREVAARRPDAAGALRRVALDGERVAWDEPRAGGGSQVVVLDLATDRRVVVSATDAVAAYEPDLGGGWVVFKEDRREPDLVTDVFAVTLASGERRRITTDARPERSPRTDGERVVWTADGELWSHELGSRATMRLAADAAQPWLDGRRLVWLDLAEGGWLRGGGAVAHVVVMDLEDRRTRRVTAAPVDVAYARLGGGAVVWLDARELSLAEGSP
jgi:hypothetical protein